MIDMRQKAIKKYCNQVCRKLICKKETRDSLISGLYGEICEAYPESVTYAELVQHLGIPQAIAEQLQEAVSPLECEKSKFARNRALIGGSVIAVAAAVAVIISAVSYTKRIDNSLPSYIVSEIEVLPPDHTDDDFDDSFIWGESVTAPPDDSLITPSSDSESDAGEIIEE